MISTPFWMRLNCCSKRGSQWSACLSAAICQYTNGGERLQPETRQAKACFDSRCLINQPFFIILHPLL